MLARRAVPLAPSKSSHPKLLLSRQHLAPISPLAATLMDLPASVANKRLTGELSSLDATLTKKRGASLRFRSWLFSARLQPCQGCCLPRVTSHQPAPTLSGSLAGRIGAAAVQGVPNV